MIENENFISQGAASCSVSIHPHSSLCLDYILLPMVAGDVTLPKFNITQIRNNQIILKPMLDTTISVRPEICSTKFV